VTENIGLSIIICTYNRAAFLADLLDSLARQGSNGVDLEVIVVDNNCSDDTAGVVAARAPAFTVLRRVEEPQQGLSHARNRGAAEARAESILFLDDDALAPDGFLGHVAEVLRKFQPDLFGGPIEPRFDTSPPVWFPPEIEARRYADAPEYSETATLSGGNFGIRKDVLARLGAFDASLGMAGEAMAFGEDRHMVERYRRETPRAEQKLYYDPKLTVLHRVGGEKLTKQYQLHRSYETARSRERVFISSGVRGTMRSRVLAAGRLALAPLTVAATLLAGGFSERARFMAMFQAWGLAGRLAGAFSSAPRSLSERS
jgi:glucosyl-dolichyl phosphate glucuronosyltransferase